MAGEPKRVQPSRDRDRAAEGPASPGEDGSGDGADV